MDIKRKINNAIKALPIPLREARNMALACALEPLSEKAGCVTRSIDYRNTLEMFIAGGINIFPAYIHLAEFLLKNRVPGMYKYFTEAVLLSKANRGGGQVNLGILEFSFPVVAAHITMDPFNQRDAFYVLNSASELLRKTNVQDVDKLIKGKQAARELTYAFRGKTYPIPEHSVATVYDYYLKEYEREKKDGHSTGVTHNKQFSQGFPDIRLAVEIFKSSSKKFSDRLVDAYNAIMAKEKNLGIGPGLAADFIAVTIYLALSYARDAEIIM